MSDSPDDVSAVDAVPLLTEDDLNPDAGHPPRRSVTWIIWAVIAVVVLLGVGFALRLSGGRPVAGTAILGQPLPALSLTTLDGARITNADLTGRTVVVNFWNTWCLPCRQEAPAVAEFAAKVADEPGVVLLAIVRDDTDAAVRENLDRAPKGWTVVTDPDKQAALGFGTRGQPETYVVTPSGIVTASKYGPVSVDDLETMFATANRVVSAP